MTEQAISLAELLKKDGEAVATAFLVYQTLDGQWVATAELDKEVNPDRAATLDDIIGGTSAVVAGCTAQQSAMMTLMMMEQRAQAQMAAMQQQQEANKVASLIDPSKLRNPRA